MRIGVVGAGAIGTIFGASLACEHDVRVLVRDTKTARTIASRGGLVIDGHAARRVDVSHDPQHLAECETLIVAVKTFSTVEALEPLRPLLHANAIVVSIQNGIDAAAQIAYALGHGHSVVVGPTTEAGLLIEPGVVKRAAPGTTVLGWAADRTNGRSRPSDLARMLSLNDLTTEAVEDSRPALWGKLVVNAAINPITALAGVTNGELLERPQLFARSRAIATEVAQLAARENVALPFADPVARVIAVATATSTNRSSMLQDFERGGRTEIDAILGAVLRRAAVHGLALRACEAAFDEVRRRTAA